MDLMPSNSAAPPAPEILPLVSRNAAMRLARSRLSRSSSVYGMSDGFVVFAYRCARVLDREAAPVLAPKDLISHVMHGAIHESCIDRTFLLGKR